MADKKIVTSDKFTAGGRLAFLRVDKPKPFSEGQEPRYEATVLIDPASPQGKKDLISLVNHMAKVSKARWGKVAKEVTRLGEAIGVPGVVYNAKAPDDGIKIKCLYDGAAKDYDGFKDRWVLATHNKNKPAVVNRKGDVVLPGEDQFPYSGCFGRLSGAFWTQDNQYGKAINVNLRGVQFAAEGEAFGAGAINAEGEFDALDDVETTGEEENPFAE